MSEILHDIGDLITMSLSLPLFLAIPIWVVFYSFCFSISLMLIFKTIKVIRDVLKNW